jgi:hypothetical protein
MLKSFANGGAGATEVAAGKFFLERSGAGCDAVEFDRGAWRSASDFEGLGRERGAE